MTRRGRPPKPTAQKELEGNPGKRPLPDCEPKYEGEPSRPDDLSPDAAEFWDSVVARLTRAGVAKEIDTHALRLLAEVWGHLRQAHRLLLSEPCDKNARIAYTTYFAKWAELAARFGLDPSSRSKLSVVPEEPEGPLSKFGIVG